MAGYLTDVAASDGHTVKLWLAARVHFPPSVYEGGRVDYLDGHPVAGELLQLLRWRRCGIAKARRNPKWRERLPGLIISEKIVMAGINPRAKVSSPQSGAGSREERHAEGLFARPSKRV